MKRTDYQTDIGIETHVQLKTQTKLFCKCANSVEAKPNTLTCPICMGFPGSLPVLNEAAIALVLRIGLALNGQIAKQTKFDRKNYFYPDLPKGYQISQYDQPIVGKGYVEVPHADGGFKVRIIRAHLEEDAGKLLHPAGVDYSLLDLNRAGTPLVEIVSEPDIHSPSQARAYVQEVYHILRYADVSDVDLYRGNLRFDVNVSVRPRASKQLGTRSETKNLNSFRSVEKTVEYEIDRQIGLLDKGEKIVQETRGWDESKGKTISQRGKEEAHDYRYFSEPDLPPLVVPPAMIDKANAQLPELPAQIRAKLSKLGLKLSQVETLLWQPQLTRLQLQADKALPIAQASRIANWLTGEVRALTAQNFDWSKFKLTVHNLKALAGLVEKRKLSSTAAKQVLTKLLILDIDPEILAKKLKVLQVSDSGELGKIVEQVIENNQKAVKDYRKGNQNSLQFLVGQVMVASKGRANPALALDLIKQQLSK